MADRFPLADQIRDDHAAQEVIQAIAQHAAPDAMQFRARCGTECGHGMDAGGAHPGLHAGPDAVDVAEIQGMQHLGQVGVLDDEKPVRLAQFRRDLGQILVGGRADRDLHALADFPPHRGLDLHPQLFHERGIPPVQGQPRPHLVDRQHRLHMDAVFYGRDHLVVDLDVFPGLGLDEDNSRALDPRIPHRGARAHAEFLGLVAGSDARRRLRHHRQDAHRPPAQAGVQVLLDAGKEAIAVDEKGSERVFHIAKTETGSRPRQMFSAFR